MLLMRSSAIRARFLLREGSKLWPTITAVFMRRTCCFPGGIGRDPSSARISDRQGESALDTVEVKPMDADSRDFRELVKAFKAAGFVVQTFFSLATGISL